MFEQTPTAQKELLLARELLEYAVLFSVSQKDDAAVERNYNQLRVYYADCRNMMPASPQENLVTGLNLLRLLVQNRIAEFHTELELIPPEAHADKHIKHVTNLEQQLMEGSYNKVLQAGGALPSPDYAHFMSMLTATVRDEIAACMEKAYATLTVTAAAKMLGMASAGEMATYGETRGWVVGGEGGGSYVFREEAKAASAKDIPSMQLINQTLLYAKELERIV